MPFSCMLAPPHRLAVNGPLPIIARDLGFAGNTALEGAVSAGLCLGSMEARSTSCTEEEGDDNLATSSPFARYPIPPFPAPSLPARVEHHADCEAMYNLSGQTCADLGRW